MLLRMALWPPSTSTRATPSTPVTFWLSLIHIYTRRSIPLGPAAMETLSAGRVENYTNRLYEKLKVILEDRNIDDARVPVSYTHLDVYKRQTNGFVPSATDDIAGGIREAAREAKGNN